MTAKADRQQSDPGDTNLNCMTWVRSVRDAMYAATSEMSPDEFIAFVQRTAGAVDAGAAIRAPSSGAGSA